VKYDAIRTDPTRMAQGIMTGIGFLGAGVSVLALFRYIESQLPSEFYAHHMLRFAPSSSITTGSRLPTCRRD
jgi:putative Mg2+ transporter-C (MgtC) family protein